MGRYRDQCIALPRSWKLIFFFLLLTSSLPSPPFCFYPVAALSESSSSLRDLTPPVLVRSINARPVSWKGFLSRKVEISKSRAVDSWRLRAEYRISRRKFRRAMKHCVSKSVRTHVEFRVHLKEVLHFCVLYQCECSSMWEESWWNLQERAMYKKMVNTWKIANFSDLARKNLCKCIWGFFARLKCVEQHHGE